MRLIRLGIVGSKSYKSLCHVDALLDRIYEQVQRGVNDYVIVSATEPASMVSRRPPAMDRVDESAIRYARGIGLKTLTSELTRKQWDDIDGDPVIERRKFLEEHSDALAAFWDGQSTHTLDVAGRFWEAKKRVQVYGPSGEVFSRVGMAELFGRMTVR